MRAQEHLCVLFWKPAEPPLKNRSELFSWPATADVPPLFFLGGRGGRRVVGSSRSWLNYSRQRRKWRALSLDKCRPADWFRLMVKRSRDRLSPAPDRSARFARWFSANFLSKTNSLLIYAWTDFNMWRLGLGWGYVGVRFLSPSFSSISFFVLFFLNRGILGILAVDFFPDWHYCLYKWTFWLEINWDRVIGE